MSENTRKININLDSLKIPSGNKTRKKRDPSTEKKIKVRTPPKAQNKSLKRNLLKFIRNMQDKKMKAENVPTTLDLDFKSDFSESLDYLSDIAKKNDMPKMSYNKTLRSQGSGNLRFPDPLPFREPTVPPYPPPGETLIPLYPLLSGSQGGGKGEPRFPLEIAPFSLPQPKYGCLKGGKLPLYKQYTRKQYDTDLQPFKIAPVFKPSVPIVQTPLPLPIATQPTVQSNFTTPSIETPPSLMPTPSIDIGKLNMFKEMSNKLSISDLYKPPVPKKRRKTLRRTYKIGKSKTTPRVSVLISNRTIRNQISNKAQMLKQTPMQEIKKHLIKNGFIKVGSIAPNDVLRKMYETSMLACGEIHNYNPENLVYNFFNIESNTN